MLLIRLPPMSHISTQVFTLLCCKSYPTMPTSKWLRSYDCVSGAVCRISGCILSCFIHPRWPSIPLYTILIIEEHPFGIHPIQGFQFVVSRTPTQASLAPVMYCSVLTQRRVAFGVFGVAWQPVFKNPISWKFLLRTFCGLTAMSRLSRHTMQCWQGKSI